MSKLLKTIKTVLGESDKAKFRFTGGMHGESEPTKKQNSAAAHLDAAEWHNNKALTYTKSLRHAMSDPNDRKWLLARIKRHRANAKEHRNLAKKL